MFAGVEETLNQTGYQAYYPQQHPTTIIEDRAQQLLESINKKYGSSEPVHLLCHSMGGLDSRFLVSPHGLNQGHRVLSLTTFSTPHRGSHLANRIPEAARTLLSIVARSGKYFLVNEHKRFAAFLGENRWDGLRQLTPAYMQNVFNPLIIDHPAVAYFSYGAKVDYTKPTLYQIPRLPAWKYMLEKEGDNDGMVSVQSAQWGTFKGVLQADHGALIGLRLFPWVENSFDHLGFFLNVAKELTEFEKNPVR